MPRILVLGDIEQSPYVSAYVNGELTESDILFADIVLAYVPDGVSPRVRIQLEELVKAGKPIYFAGGKVSTFITEKKREAEDDLVNIELESYRHRMLEEMSNVETMLHDSNIDAGRRGELEADWMWLLHYYIRAFPDKLMILKQMRQRYFPEEYK